MSVKVNETMAFHISNESLTFGRISPGKSGWRTITISNAFDTKVKIKISQTPPFDTWSKPSDNHFILKPKESRELNYSVNIPKNAEFGIYNGTATIRTIRVI